MRRNKATRGRTKKRLAALLDRQAGALERDMQLLDRVRYLLIATSFVSLAACCAHLAAQLLPTGLLFGVLGALSIVALSWTRSVARTGALRANSLRGAIVRSQVKPGDYVSLFGDVPHMSLYSAYFLGEVLSVSGDCGTARLLSLPATKSLPAQRSYTVRFYRSHSEPSSRSVLFVERESWRVGE